MFNNSIRWLVRTVAVVTLAPAIANAQQCEAHSSTQEYCSCFDQGTWTTNEKETQVEIVDLDPDKNGRSYFALASSAPDPEKENTTFLRPQLKSGAVVSQFSFYRVAFFLVSDRTSSFVSGRAPRNFAGAADKWSIELTSALVAENEKARPLKITQGTLASAYKTSAFGEPEFTLDHDLPLFLSPAARSSDPIKVTSSAGAPLLVARYVLNVETIGEPLGFYDGKNFDDKGPNSPKSCFVRASEIESAGVSKANFAETLKTSIDLRASENLPFSGAVPTSAGIAQSRIDAMSDATVWLMTHIYRHSGVNRSFPCTGFMVSPRHVMTARHCVYSNNRFSTRYDCKATAGQRCEIRAWRRRPGGDSRINAPTHHDLRLVFHGLDSSDPDSKITARLDYAILEINDKRDHAQRLNYNAPIVAPLADEPQDPTAVTIPQYPNSRAFVVAYDRHCGTRFNEHKQDSSGVKNANQSFFRHYCDTNIGSSGSPVFTSDLKHVVGVHVGGWRAHNDPRWGNSAVKMSAVFADLCRRAKSGDAKLGSAEALAILTYQRTLNDPNREWTGAVPFPEEKCSPFL